MSDAISQLLPGFVPLLGALAAAVAAYVVYQRFFSPLAGVPGPLLASLTSYWLVRVWSGHHVSQTYVDIHEKYGPVVRTGPNTVDITDPETVRRVYSAGTGFNKSDYYSVFKGASTWNLFAEQDEEVHGRQRRAVARVYSIAYLKELESYVNTVIEDISNSFQKLGPTGLDFSPWAGFFAYDVIGEVTFGKSFGYVQAGFDDGSQQMTLDAMRAGGWVGQVPWVYRLRQRIADLTSSDAGAVRRHSSLNKAIVGRTKERIESGESGHHDQFSGLLQFQALHPDRLPDIGIEYTAHANIVAGADTTSITMRTLIFYILSQPNTKARVLADLALARKAGRLSDPVTMDEGMALPYWQACIHEALRIHPAVNFPMPRVVPAPGLAVSGHFLPAGTEIGANAWVQHRNKDVFGPDVEKFRPDRWIDNPNHALMMRHWMPFGGGLRICIGKNVAWMELTKLIPTLFNRFDMELTKPGWTVDDAVFAVQTGINVRLTPRKDAGTP